MSVKRSLGRRLWSAYGAARQAVGLPRREGSLVKFVIRRRNAVRIDYTDAHQSRQEATAHLLLEALKTIKYEARRNRRLVIYTTDRPPPDPGRPVMSYSALAGSRNVIAVPDFSFWNWPDVGIEDYPQVAGQMIAAGARPPTDGRLFWIGNPETSPVRKRLLEIAAGDPRILATPITWVRHDRPESWASDAIMATRASNYVSLPDHCRHKYLIDIEGAGYSARLKLLLFSNRPVFLQDRPWREFYFDELEPFRHYIPVAGDLADLSRKLDWAEAHPEECRRIAANALDFAQRRLTRAAAIAHLRQVIQSLLA